MKPQNVIAVAIAAASLVAGAAFLSRASSRLAQSPGFPKIGRGGLWATDVTDGSNDAANAVARAVRTEWPTSPIGDRSFEGTAAFADGPYRVTYERRSDPKRAILTVERTPWPLW